MSKWLDSASFASDKELLQAETYRLARLIDALTPNDGTFGQSIPSGMSIREASRIKAKCYY